MTVPAVTVPPLLRSKKALTARWENMRLVLRLDGLPESRARTEAACAGALEIWETVNRWRRRERAVGSMRAARVLEAALRPLQDIVVQLLRDPDDPEAGAEAIRRARGDFESSSRDQNAQASEAFHLVMAAFGSLEAVLLRTASRAA